MDFMGTCLNSDCLPDIFETRLLNVCDGGGRIFPICHPFELWGLDFVVRRLLGFSTTALIFRLAAIGVCHIKIC